MEFQRAVEKFIPAAHHSGERDRSDITLLVIHSTEGDSAIGAASWWQDARSGGSAHLVGDGDHLYRALRDNQVAWGVADVNTEALHYEIAAYASWKYTFWMTPKARRRWHQCAYRLARWSIQYDVPLNFRTVSELNNMSRLTGVTVHGNLSRSRHSSSTHTDPGRGFPIRRTMRATRRYKQALLAEAASTRRRR